MEKLLREECSFWADELRIEEKLGVNGEGEEVSLVRPDSLDAEVSAVDRGVRPRRDVTPAAEGPQAEFCPLTGRTPEPVLSLEVLRSCVAGGGGLKFI